MVTFDYKKSPITQIADYIIMYSAKSGASDIHFDPHEDGLMVRIRVDGDLQDYTLVPPDYERNLVTRLKLLANMNITESRLPQDGSIKGKFGNLYLDMRVSSLPTNQGEKIVIRILDYSRSLEGLEALGFSHKNFEKLKRMIAVPNGILLVTGATGSGKSTTTYSILQALNKKEVNIITVEDPVEMNIEGLNQVQVNSEIGLDFATVLRSILRQDPNVILIGEIRDSETAKIAVRASITGHFVLSTIHTNNSLATIERLLDMDVERYLLSSALTGIISQRLAKRVCPKCRILRETTEYEKKVFKMALGKDVEKVYDANHDGCSECHNGYRDRIAVQEVLEIDDDIRLSLNNENLTKEEMRDMVYTSNVTTLLQDGLNKVLEGITTFEEIYRIIEIDIDDDTYTTPVDEEAPAEEKEEKKEESTEEKQPDEEKVEEQNETTNENESNEIENTQAADEAATEETKSTKENNNDTNEEDSNIPSIDDILANIDNNSNEEEKTKESEPTLEEISKDDNDAIDDILASAENDKKEKKEEKEETTIDDDIEEEKSFESIMPDIDDSNNNNEENTNDEPTLEEETSFESFIPSIEESNSNEEENDKDTTSDEDNEEQSIIPNIEGATETEESTSEDSDDIIPSISTNDNDNETEPTLIELPKIEVELEQNDDENKEEQEETDNTSSNIYENPNLAGLERL